MKRPEGDLVCESCGIPGNVRAAHVQVDLPADMEAGWSADFDDDPNVYEVTVWLRDPGLTRWHITCHPDSVSYVLHHIADAIPADECDK